MRVILAGTGVAVLVTGIFLARPDAVAKLDDRVCDVLAGWVSRGTPSGRIAIVEIDEASLAERGRWPWPRDVMGLLVRRILDRGAAAVVLDMMLHDEDRGGAATREDALAGAMAGKPVVVGYAFRFDAGLPADPPCRFSALPVTAIGPEGAWERGFFHATGVLCSAPAISEAAAGNGFLNAAPDSDGRLRRVPLVIDYGVRQYPSLALAAWSAYRRVSSVQLNLTAREASRLRAGTQVVRLEGPSTMRLRYRGGRRTFPYIAAADVLKEGGAADMLRGKIALVGGSALGLPNPVATPVDPLLPEIEVEATAIDNLLLGDAFHRPAALRFWESMLALAAGVVATLLLARMGSWRSAWIALGMAAGAWAGCAVVLAWSGLVVSPLPVTAVLACSIPVVTLLCYAREKTRAERTEQQLSAAHEHGSEALRESESRYARLVENVNDAIIMDDAAGRLVFANRRFREWFGLEGKDIHAVTLEDFVALEWWGTVRDLHTRRMRGEKVAGQYEFEGVRHDGSRIWIEALVTTIEKDGQIVGSQAALRDITERKRMEAQYLQAQKLESIGRLAGVVAHDFNNLLTVINGYCELLLNSRPDESKYEAGLKQIRSSGERAAELTKNLLAFSRKQPAKLKAVDLNSVVAEAEKMFARLMGENVELSARLSPALAQVTADAGQMQQILMNLLVNARDAMPQGGQISIETANVFGDEEFLRQHPGFEAGDYVCLGVTDNGSGMSDEVKRHLFEPFFTTKEPGKGTGLGLATVYGIVHQNGGNIEVTSETGKGTTFRIYFPRAKTEAGAEAAPGAAVRAMKGSETVLVVEDQEALRRFMCAVLEESGYRVVQAANGPDALAVAEQFRGTIHLLVTDLILPDMNGRELAERLTASRPGIRVLFTSGYEEEATGARVAYLPKPFGPEGLAAKVREALGNPTPSDIGRARSA